MQIMSYGEAEIGVFGISIPKRQDVDHSPDEYIHELDIYDTAISLIPAAIDIARYERSENAVSYRGLHVGAAVLAVDGEAGGLKIFSGANVKPRGSKDKTCAEQIALDRAKKAKMARAVVIVVAGPSDYDELMSVTHRPSHTLYPCEDKCLRLFGSHTLMQFNANALIVSVGATSPEGDKYEAQFAQDLPGFYSDPNPRLINQIPFYDAHNGAFGSVGDLFAALRFGAEHSSLPFNERPSPAQLALEALRNPMLQRFVVERQTKHGPRLDVVGPNQRRNN